MGQRAQLVASLLVAVVIAVVVILLVSARVPVDDDSGRGRGRGRGGDDDESFVAPTTGPVRLGFVVTWPAQRTSTSPIR